MLEKLLKVMGKYGKEMYLYIILAVIKNASHNNHHPHSQIQNSTYLP